MVTAQKQKKSIVSLNIDQELVLVEITADDHGKKTAKFKKQILKAGKFTHPQHKDKKIIFNAKIFAKIKDAFDAELLDNVPVIIGTHDEEKTIKIVGRVLELIIEKKGLYAILELADEELIEKIEAQLSDGKGLIDEVSVSLAPIINDDGKTADIALFHVAIVTHAWFRGMDSFEKLAASLEADFENVLVILNGSIDLQERIFRVRIAFHAQNHFSSLFVETVFDDSIIAVDDSNGELFKLTYKILKDGEIEFGEPVQVEKTFKEVSAKVDIKELLSELKEHDIEFDSIEDLKKRVDASSEEGLAAFLTASLKKAGVSVDDKDEEPDKVIAGLIAQVKALEPLTAKVATLTDTILTVSADKAVNELLNKGIILPTQKDSYIELYKRDKDSFDSITADAKPVVEIGEDGRIEGEETGKTEGEVEDEVSRLTGQTTASSNGKNSDKGDK